jgi:ketosteroid isomerase-like protein
MGRRLLSCVGALVRSNQRLFANEAFYAAFATRDIEAMREIWSRSPTVTCIHPGWAPIIGRQNVLRSWQAILSNPQSPLIICSNASAYVLSDVAYVLCHEHVEQTALAATNVFVREGGGWKMVHHQAGPSPPPSVDPADTREPMQ